MRSHDLHHEGQSCLVVLRGELHEQQLSYPEDPQVKNLRAFRKIFRILPVMAYDNYMSGLRASFYCQFSFTDDARDALVLPLK